MNTEGDFLDNERIPASFWYSSPECQAQSTFRANDFTEHKDGTEQDQNMEYASTNQPRLDDLGCQTSEAKECPELATITAQLQETASYAINPSFKQELRKRLLQQFVAHHTGVFTDSL